MAFKIKPEDVTPELQNRADTEFSAWYDGPVIDVASIINAAIEAGLVSPPVWAVIVDEKSPEFKYSEGPVNPVHLATTKEKAAYLIQKDCYDKKTTRIEHWKGQTS